MPLDPAILHYDTIIRARDDMRGLIDRALAGDRSEFDRALNFTDHAAPSMRIFLESALAYAQCGQQVFVVGPQLQKMLLDTDCHQVPEQFLKVPYKSFYIALPDTSLKVYGGQNTGYHQIGGVYVHQPFEGQFMFAVWGRANEKSIRPDDDATLWAGLSLSKVPRTVKDGLVLYDIEGYLKTRLLRTDNEMSDFGVTTDPTELRRSWNVIPDIARIAMNLILYLASSGADIERDDTGAKAALAAEQAEKKALDGLKSPGKRKKLQRRNERAAASRSKASIIWVGKKLEGAKSASTGLPRDTGGWSTRRGHFHSFWTGRRTNPDGSPRTNPDGSRIFGDKLIIKWVLPVYRAPRDRRHEYHFTEDNMEAPNGEGSEGEGRSEVPADHRGRPEAVGVAPAGDRQA